MLINAQRLVDKTRLYLQDPAAQQQGNSWLDSELVDFLNEEQEGLVAKVLQASDDYFAVFKDFAINAGQSVYPLFDGFLQLRRAEILPSDPNSEASGLTESRLIEGISGVGHIGTVTDSPYNYALYGDDFHIAPEPSAGGSTARGWFIRDPGPILLEIPASIVGGDAFVFSSADAPPEADIMVGAFVDVVAGTGAGQRRKITAYTAGKQATVSAAFSPGLDSTSKIATISRLPRLFHTLLAYGAGVRAKIQAEEDARGLTALYNDRLDDFEEFLGKWRTYAQRGSIPFDLD